MHVMAVTPTAMLNQGIFHACPRVGCVRVTRFSARLNSFLSLKADTQVTWLQRTAPFH